ncbi:MAG: DoxX family protein [Pyrinomonadaceae bacterium]
MESFLGRYSTYIYAVLRIVSGFLFMWHGSQKLIGYPPSGSTSGEALSTVMAIGGGIELVGGFLIMIGLFTGFAAFLASGTMAFAYFGWHFSFNAPLPIVNKGELAVVYCFLFLYIASRGSGVWSVESIFKGTRAAITDKT